MRDWFSRTSKKTISDVPMHFWIRSIACIISRRPLRSDYTTKRSMHYSRTNSLIVRLVLFAHVLQVTLWSLNGKAPYLKYALEVTPVLMKFYEELFGISYPLPKLSMYTSSMVLLER